MAEVSVMLSGRAPEPPWWPKDAIKLKGGAAAREADEVPPAEGPQAVHGSRSGSGAPTSPFPGLSDVLTPRAFTPIGTRAASAGTDGNGDGAVYGGCFRLEDETPIILARFRSAHVKVGPGGWAGRWFRAPSPPSGLLPPLRAPPGNR